MEIFIYSGIAFIAGALLTYVYLKSRNESILPVIRRENNSLQQTITKLELDLQNLLREKNQLLTETGRLSGQLEQSAVRLDERHNELEVTAAKLEAAQHEITASEKQLEYQQENLNRLKDELEAMSARMRADFRQMADTILEEKTK